MRTTTMGLRKMVVSCLVLTPIIALSAPSEPPSKSTREEIAKALKPEPSGFGKEFGAWADKQDWFALGDTAEFGDFNRKKSAEKGMPFGYSTEFVDSKGEKHILGIGLAKDQEREVQKAMKCDMAAMSAQKSLMMHGQNVSTNAVGGRSRSVNGTLLGAVTLLSKTIVRPGTEEKWFLRVCTGKRQADNMPPDSKQPKECKSETTPSGEKVGTGNDKKMPSAASREGMAGAIP